MMKTSGFRVNVEKFKEEADLHLKKFGLEGLRSYGRKVGVRVPTKLKKQELILETIAVICGEKEPDWTNQGAPIKNEFIPPELIAGIDELKRVYLYGEEPTEKTECKVEKKAAFEKPYYTITVRDENRKEVMSLGTSLDFQIILSNQSPITSKDLAKEASENNR